jgi:endonuclease III related protein
MSLHRADAIMNIYEKLCVWYGPQGWWPLINYEVKNPTKTGSIRGYHPLNYELPETEAQKFEVIVGAILTQNTAWTSAEKAIHNLYELKVLNPKKLLSLDDESLKGAIRCAGFLNQKAVYLAEISKFFLSLKGRTPKRMELLEVKGVGNETADSILLYAYKKPEFVVDTYTKRIFSHIGFIEDNAGYMQVKEMFEKSLPQEVSLFQEYHALIVEHGKRYYSRKPYGVDDPLKILIPK